MANNPNPMRDYVENFRANLPAGITYDSTIGRYFCNDRRFLNEWEVERYLNYIKKFGFTAFSAYAVANLEPPLVLDFEQEYYRTGGSDTTFGDAITHSRSSSATYVDATGTIQTAAIDEPRLNHHVYNGTEWVNEGLLHESEARTNLVTYSTPDDTNWINGGVVVTENVSGQTAPDGSETLTFFRENVSTAVHFFSTPSISFVSGGTYTFFAFVKKATAVDIIQLTFPSAAFGSSQYANFNTSTGSFGNVAGVTTHVEDLGNGVYRVGITASATATASGSTGFVLTDNNDGLGRTPTYTGDGASGFYVWGAQLEAGATPSSYIPTSGSTVTRAADTLTVPSANLPYDSTNMSIQMDGRMTGESLTFADWSADASNNILLTSGASDFTFTQEASGTVDSVTGGSFTSGINVPYNIASRHGSTFINGAIDGTALTADTTPTALPDLSTTDLDLAPTYMGTIRKLRMWPDDLGDTGIEEASS